MPQIAIEREQNFIAWPQKETYSESAWSPNKEESWTTSVLRLGYWRVTISRKDHERQLKQTNPRH